MFKVNKEKSGIVVMIFLAIMGLAIVEVNAYPSTWQRLCKVREILSALDLMCLDQGGYDNMFEGNEEAEEILDGDNLAHFCCYDPRCDEYFLEKFCLNNGVRKFVY